MGHFRNPFSVSNLLKTSSTWIPVLDNRRPRCSIYNYSTSQSLHRRPHWRTIYSFLHDSGRFQSIWRSSNDSGTFSTLISVDPSHSMIWLAEKWGWNWISGIDNRFEFLWYQRNSNLLSMPEIQFQPHFSANQIIEWDGSTEMRVENVPESLLDRQMDWNRPESWRKE